jgi:hypothetical protein
MAFPALATGERIANKAMMDLIVNYFSVGYKYKDILASLLLIHGLKVSYRHFKRIIKKLNLQRRTVESNNEDIFRAILGELSGSGKCIGYKAMWKDLNLNMA